MSRRTKIVIGVILALLLLLGLYFLLPRQDTVVEGVGDTFVNQPRQGGGLLDTSTSSNVNRPTGQPAANVNAAVPPAPPDERSNLRRIAAAFAERFGSFSNQSDYENIFELKVLMTARMQAWADGFVEQQRSDRQASAVYFGVTTRSISTVVEDFDEAEDTATVRVSTQRREESGESVGSKVYYQDIVIDFVKEGDIWKVDEAVWQPR